MYIGDISNNRIRKVTVSTGIISLIAGTGATGSSGDGGPATSAELYGPTGIALDSSGIHSWPLCVCIALLTVIPPLGNVYFCDEYNGRVRKIILSTSIISTIAGTNTRGYSGDGGAATSAALTSPTGIALDSLGTITKLCLFK